MTNLTMITADEEAGMALTLLILTQTDKGRELLAVGWNDEVTVNGANVDPDAEDTIDNEALNTRCRYEDFVEVIEMMLSFHAWYKSEVPIPWVDGSKHALTTSLRTMLATIKRVIPRTYGNGWKIQKFHELLHIATDVEMFGSPKNFDTGIMENRLIHIGKKNSKNTQKRGATIYTRQLGLRIQEQQTFAKTKRCLGIVDQGVHLSPSDDDVSVNSVDLDVDKVTRTQKKKPCYRLFIVGTRLRVQWLTRTVRVVPELILLKLKLIMLEIGITELDIYTEIKHNGLTYRSHPNYRGGGAWFDWAAVRFEPSEEDVKRCKEDDENGVYTAFPHGYYPVKLLCYFKIEDVLHFLCHSTETKISSSEDSCLTERWNLEYERQRFGEGPHLEIDFAPVLGYCEVACIHDRLYVVEESSGFHAQLGDNSPLVVLVKNRILWPRYFTET
jgi:hypothetical protein